MLCLIEAVNFIDEDDGSSAELLRFLGVSHHRLDLLDASEHGRELDEFGLGHVGDDLRERRLAHARGSPEDHRAWIIALDLRAQRLAGPEDLLLTDKFVECAGTHALGQWTLGVCCGTGRNGVEKAHSQADCVIV